MIGSGLKKLAKENGMTVYGGLAYGSLRGFAATLSEGAGFKKIDFAVSFPDPAGRVALTDQIAVSNIRSNYRVINFACGAKGIQVTFHDTVGTMKKIREFLAFFLPLLEQNGATRADICAECGGQMVKPQWVQINGICYPLHESCVQRVHESVLAKNEAEAQAETGNYVTGFLGALVGAMIGAVVWALVLNAGYVASLVGLLIGWLAEKGYTLAKGKNGKGKLWILILVILLAVALGTFGSDAMELAKMISGGELYGFRYSEIPMFILALLADSQEYRSAIVYNLGMGVLFAGLGVFFILRQAVTDGGGTKFRKMK